MAPVVTALVALIALAHAVTWLLSRPELQALSLNFGVVPLRFQSGDIGGAFVSLFASAFVHAGLLHLFFNSMIILQTGELVAARLGRDGGGALRFLALFFASAAAGGLVYVLVNWGSDMPAVGASGAACGLFAAYLMAPFARPWDAFRAREPLTMGFYFVLVNVGLAALARFTGVLPIAWEAHLGGFVAGLVLFPFLLPRTA